MHSPDALKLAAQIVLLLRDDGRPFYGLGFRKFRGYRRWSKWRDAVLQKCGHSDAFEHALLSAQNARFKSENEAKSAIAAHPCAAQALEWAEIYLDVLAEARFGYELAQAQRRFFALTSDDFQPASRSRKPESGLPVVKFPRSPIVFILDFVFRLTFAAMYGRVEDNELSGWDAIFALAFIILSQPLLLLLAFLWDGFQARKQRKLYAQWRGEGGGAFKIDNVASLGGLLFLAASWIQFSAYLHYSFEVSGGAWVVISLYHLAFLSLAWGLFSRGSIAYDELTRQVEAQTLAQKECSPDENDEVIVTLESRLKSIQQRLEGYVLEGALLGALAFGGFLEILSQNTIQVEDLARFGDKLNVIFKHLVLFKAAELPALFAGIATQTDLFCMVSALSLTSSIFFLLVIAHRLRFSDVADKIQHFITLAHDYNEKEDELYRDREKLGAEDARRLATFSRKVSENLRQAQAHLTGISPISGYMRLFRSLGVMTFFVVVISGALFIANWLSWLFVASFLGSQVYFNRGRIAAGVRTASHAVQETLFLGHAYYAGGAALFLFAGLWLRYNQAIEGTTWPTVGLAVWIALRLLALTLLPQENAAPTDNDSPTADHDAMVRRFRRFFGAVSEVLFYLVVVFKFVLHLPGANELFIFWFLISTFVGVGQIFAFKTLNAGEKITASAGWVLLLAGGLFKFLHYAGANYLLLAGVGGYLLFVALATFNAFKPLGTLRYGFAATLAAYLVGFVCYFLSTPYADWIFSLSAPAGLVACGIYVFRRRLKNGMQTSVILAAAAMLLAAGHVLGVTRWASPETAIVFQCAGAAMLSVLALKNNGPVARAFNNPVAFVLIVLAVVPHLLSPNILYLGQRLAHPNTIYRNFEDWQADNRRIRELDRMELDSAPAPDDLQKFIHEADWYHQRTLRMQANNELNFDAAYRMLGNNASRLVKAANGDGPLLRRALVWAELAAMLDTSEVTYLHLEICEKLNDCETSAKWVRWAEKKRVELNDEEIDCWLERYRARCGAKANPAPSLAPGR